MPRCLWDCLCLLEMSASVLKVSEHYCRRGHGQIYSGLRLSFLEGFSRFLFSHPSERKLPSPHSGSWEATTVLWALESVLPGGWEGPE